MKSSFLSFFAQRSLLITGTLVSGAATAHAQIAAIRPVLPAPPVAAPAAGTPAGGAPALLGSAAAAGGLQGTTAVQTVDIGINVLIIPLDAISGAPRVASLEYGRFLAQLQNNESALQVWTRALAQQKPQDDLFRAEPDVRATFPRRPRNGDAALPTDAEPRILAPLPQPGDPLPPVLVPGGGVRLSDIPGEIGAAAAAAAPLRRALVRNGYLDVQSAAPDGAAVRRAINERRLSERSLERLQNALQLLATSMAVPNADPNAVGAAPDLARTQNAQAQGVTAAAQIGQALGYRGVVVLAVMPNAVMPNAAVPNAALANSVAPPVSSTYAMLLVDAYRESGEFLAFDEGGADALTASETAASTGAALLDKKLDMWAPVTAADRSQRAADYLQRARNFVTQRDVVAATEALNQSLALDPGQREAQIFLGDILLTTDPLGAAAAYRRALDSGAAQPGPTWEKIATSYATAKDWPRTLDAGRRALAQQWDTASLRMAMATAQFGRADLFRKANRDESADDAETDARRQLDRARELSPDDPNITRLLAQQLVAQGRVREAAESLDKLMALVEEPDLELLTLYATALTERGGRDVDAFLAWARVWRQSGVSGAPMNAVRYRRISEGFDQYVSDTARQAAQLTLGVANGTLPRETALLQLQKMAEDAKAAEVAIKILQPPSSALNEANHASRLFAATTISQAVNSHRVYVETGDDIYRSRANELHRQAIMQLNIARGAKNAGQR